MTAIGIWPCAITATIVRHLPWRWIDGWIDLYLILVAIQLSKQQHFADSLKVTSPPTVQGACNGSDKVVLPPSLVLAQKEYEEAIAMENTIQDKAYTKAVGRFRRAAVVLDDSVGPTSPLGLSNVPSFMDMSSSTENSQILRNHLNVACLID